VELQNYLYFYGDWLKGHGTFPVHDPRTGEVIAAIQTAGEKECDAAIAAANEAFKIWSKTAPRVRGELLRKAFETMLAEADHDRELSDREGNLKNYSGALRRNRPLNRS
jgi:succinate-semialdehyde dehydrogenase/glutarate-semialdehyde dehydrogenase